MPGSTAVVNYNLPVEDVVSGGEPSRDSNWKEVAERIQQGDQSAMEELYRVFAKGIRFCLCRQLGSEELDDRVHDTFLIVVQAIQRNEIREPERLMGFVRTVVRRQVASYIGLAVRSRRDEASLDIDLRVPDTRYDLELGLAWRQKVELMKEVLGTLSPRDREILTRFYLREESQESICADMHLSETQFRLLKSRAKSRFGALGRRRLQQKSLVAVCIKSNLAADGSCDSASATSACAGSRTSR
jgi:RNA polymerase sigma-70 factor (ECF subfamily)